MSKFNTFDEVVEYYLSGSLDIFTKDDSNDFEILEIGSIQGRSSFLDSFGNIHFFQGVEYYHN